MALKRTALIVIAVSAISVSAPASGSATPSCEGYPWLDEYEPEQALQARIPPPPGYERIEAEPGTFAVWLRGLPLLPAGTPVRYHDGRPKPCQGFHEAVMDLDVGDRDLQQCADAAIRLRAEYLYSSSEYDRIHFDFTSGDVAKYSDWCEGYRPIVRGDQVTWSKSQAPDSSYACFRGYLDAVFTYAGTYSLSRELRGVEDPLAMEIGDVFIQGGFPGHAAIVVDMAEHRRTGERIFLLAQSYMPAQDLHVLKNPEDAGLSPWYGTDFGEILPTAQWYFERGHLHRWPPD